eukprot:CAMPEP_0184869148 /NCGR_PEP_ID=MMETSP0580-20130426/33133_1 /TAXON_ID=1118495 /ORGANISM="Dactyliosolen fragilissimus" /LENGTH=54 /DNA_ID=CAMNT_0027370463 /DNA_START=93 /DNA_END=254 /DNA_ORIENTATION=-
MNNKMYRCPSNNTNNNSICSGGGSKTKRGSAWATREIAALDFLMGIPLEAEREI